MAPKVRDIIKRLEDEGWALGRQKGSHRQFTRPQKPGVVTIAGKPSATPPPKTWESIQKQAGWK